jgi:hypothetical protein
MNRYYSNVLYNGRALVLQGPITLPLLRRGVGSESEVGIHAKLLCLPHSIIRGDNYV